MKPIPLTKQYASLRSIKTVIQKSAGKYAKTDLEKLLDQLRTLCTLVEAQVQVAPTEQQAQTIPTEAQTAPAEDNPANPPQV